MSSNEITLGATALAYARQRNANLLVQRRVFGLGVAYTRVAAVCLAAVCLLTLRLILLDPVFNVGNVWRRTLRQLVLPRHFGALRDSERQVPSAFRHEWLLLYHTAQD